MAKPPIERSAFHYTTERRLAMQKALGLDDEDFEPVIEAIEGWAQHILTESRATFSPTEGRARIRAVHKQAGALKAALDDSDWAYLSGFRNPAGFRARLEQLHAAAEQAAQMQLPRGAAEQVAEKWFVEKLLNLYEETTGKKATITFDPHKDQYGGRFFLMVKACLAPPIARHSDGALVKLIKRARTMDKKTD